jgi:LysR family transcriptional regulator, transcriptional activator of nhaA
MNIYNYNHIFYFYVTAKLEGVTAAARHLHTSQSSLSTQIKTFEKVLGRKLFKKVGRKMELTDSGKELFSYCRRAFEIFDEMFDQNSKKNSSMGIRTSVGVSVDIERPFITEALSRISKEYGKSQRPRLNLISLPTNQLLQLLKLGEIDLLLSNKAVGDSDFETLEEFEFSVGLFATKETHRKVGAKSAEILLKDQDIPFVLPSKITSLRFEIDEYLAKKKYRPICVFESNIIASVIRAARDDMGFTILPRVYVDREVKTGKLLQLNSKPLWKHRMALITSRQSLDEGRKLFAQKLSQYFIAISG